MWQYWNQNSFGCTLTQMVCTEETAKKELWLQYQKGTSGEGVAGKHLGTRIVTYLSLYQGAKSLKRMKVALLLFFLKRILAFLEKTQIVQNIKKKIRIT